jgi:beta-glucosidase
MISGCFIAQAQVAQQVDCTSATCVYLDSTLAPEIRAQDLVRRMTPEEKVTQTVDHSKSIPRLHVAEYNWWNEGLHGVARSGVATVFPQSIGMAATWDPTLIRNIADIISTEARARNNEAVRAGHFGRYTGLTYWSPNINIFRDPRWGRGQETYGEDPFLTATMGVAFIRGLQGDDPHHPKVVATPKHFAVHSGPEATRHSVDVHPTLFDLQDTYLPAFRAAITEGKADSIMCAYNAVDGFPACASPFLLQTILRDQWKFNGFVVSDCDAIGDVYRGHHFAPNEELASILSLKAGTDLDCGATYDSLLQGLHDGQLRESELDSTLVRLFTARIELGMFDSADRGPLSYLSNADIHTAEHRSVALQAARESIVLLKNKNNILPLTNPQTIAVIGPTAELLQAVQGNYMGTPMNPVLPLRGVQNQFGFGHVSYSPGSILVDGLTTPVSSKYLKPSPESKDHGLSADYYNNLQLSGAPATRRVDEMINFNWDGLTPTAELKSQRFSIRWSGCINFPKSGKYTLAFHGLPRAKKTIDVTGEGQQAGSTSPHLLRVYLDEKLVIDSSTDVATIDLPAAKAGDHAIRIEFVHDGNARSLSLEWLPPAEALLDDAVLDAQKADIVVAFVGLSPDVEGEQMSVHAPGFNGGDRTDIALPSVQEHLLEAVQKTGKPLVVVLTSGSALAVNWEDQHVNAILEAWYGGEEVGTAIAETLAGINHPSGRLPVTFFKSIKDLPAFDDYSMENRTYRYFTGDVLYPFGFGLSYASINFGKATLSSNSIRAGEPVNITTIVKNVSPVESDQIVQVYVDSPGGKQGAHAFLAGFQRVRLGANETKEVTLSLAPRQLSRVDERGERLIIPGLYKIWIGDGQPGHTLPPIEVPLLVTGSLRLPD